MSKYKYCNNCKENSVLIVGAKPRKFDGRIKRKEICLNDGCPFSRDLDPDVPTVAAIKKKMGLKQGQKTFNF